MSFHEPQVWRIHLNSDSIASVDPKQFCFDNNIVGVGWRAPSSGPFLTPEEYKASAVITYGQSTSWQAAINAICYGLQPGHLVWTRDGQGNYYLGRIEGDWQYQDAQSNLDADMLNIRPCIWHKVGTADAVPGKVASSFFSRRTLQHIYDEPVATYSKFLLENIDSPVTTQTLVNHTYDERVFSIMSPDDCEDLVGLYLQLEKDYLLIPSSCKASTQSYEYSLVHKLTGRPALVQVKLGTVDISYNDYSSVDADVYLCTTEGQYLGDPKANIHVIAASDLLRFLSGSAAILPEKLKNRLRLYQQLYF